MDDDYFEDETLVERFIGLHEMFPSPIRTLVSGTVNKASSAAAWTFGTSRSWIWYATSTFLLLGSPMIIEVNRIAFEEQSKQRERNILLGPSIQ